MSTPGRPAKASSRGFLRSSGPAGARPETAAAASCESAGGPLGELFGHGQHVAVSVRVESDDAVSLEVAKNAGARDLKGIGHIGGRKARQRAEFGRAICIVCAGNVYAIEEDRVQVRVEFQV